MSTSISAISDTEMNGYVVPRFIKYTGYWTTSDRHVEDTPSTPGQWDLAKALAEELNGLGLADVELTDHCYVIARLPATSGKENNPVVGFLAHIDTSSDVSGKDVKPILVKNYDGRRIELQGGFALDPAEDPDLASQKGRDIIHTDGSTLLGADDKAGIAEIVGAVEYIIKHPEIEHGPVELIFSPDEETGKGLPEIPLKTLKSKACYTLDGGPIGELEIECFNAYGVHVEFQGKVIHLGHARGELANAVLMAAYYAAMLPRSESPEATDGYYGYYCPTEITGKLETASLEVFIRDFDHDGALRRIEALKTFAKAVEAQFPGGTVTVTPKLQYYNMKKKIDAQPRVLEILKTAADNLGLSFTLKPIRGGTDGARLTEMGIPTPNIFTGGRNFHSRTEWASVPDMLAASRLVIELIRLWGGETS
ncbi:peptidase T [Breznakiella homolactica]|uniref:Peptidase T n=1 Tax=Breznakiella homolactica TaxID=2798577 RepID=A0A7T7XPE9_9SPIR|nr:peptidase T [Breznakiella homolactica]QQO10061.1 peptidase T [Breznakiella homolactica]